MNYTIVIASTNPGKIAEITEILKSLKDFSIQIRSLQDYKISEPDEPYDSFLKNAIHKAQYYAKHTKEITLSEDSGLSIEALNGFPGVRTKEITQEFGGMANTFVKLQQMLNGSKNYAAHFNCAMALYIPDQDYLISHQAKDYGSLSFPPRGDAGFAFDPIFVPQGYDKIFAELGMELKNNISHRAKALQGLIEKFCEK